MPERSSKRPRHGLVALADRIHVSSKIDQQLFVGECVSSDAAERSDLLAGLLQTDGLAALPATIQPEDVQLWQAACLLIGEPSTDELVTVIRVADALGDRQLCTWTELMGNRAFCTDWKDPAAADAMAYALLALPPHLLNATLRTVIGNVRYPRDAWSLITDYPAPLHPAIISAMVKRMLHVPADHCGILHALAAAAPPPPGLQELQVDDHREFPSIPMQPGDCFPETSAAVLAHPSLTSLHFTSPMQPQWLAKLAACLHPSALPGLCHFSLCVHARPGATATVTRCLKRLPSLSRLEVHMHLASDQEEQAASLSSLTRTAAPPAALTSLTELSLRVLTHAAPSGEGGRGEGGVGVHAATTLLQLLPLLHAPALASLNLSTTSGRVSAEQLCFATRRLASIKHISIQSNFRALQSLSFLSQPRTERQMPALHSLDIQSNGFLSPYTLASELLAVTPTALTSLTLSPHWYGDEQHSTADMCGFTAQLPGSSLSNVLCRGGFSALRVLRLGGLCASLGPDNSHNLAAALAHLTVLTQQAPQSDYELEVARGTGAPPRAVLLAAPLATALPQLQSLQRLRLCGMTSSPLFDEPAVFLQSCSALGSLRHLVVGRRDVICRDLPGGAGDAVCGDAGCAAAARRVGG
eukprot:jgi/Ulvmu1/3433/UM016_0052.1